MSRYDSLVESYRTERLKTLSVWSQVPDARTTFRPEPRSAHCVSAPVGASALFDLRSDEGHQPRRFPTFNFTLRALQHCPPKYHVEHAMPGAIPARSADTALDAERVQVALLRAAPVARRLHLALALSATIIGAARRGLARAQPRASARDLDLRFVELHYGAEVAAGLRADLDRRDATRRPGA